MDGGYKWQIEPPEAIYILRRYNITVEQFNERLIAQEGRCRICGKFNGKKRLVVDHDHTTGEVRGLLCNLCNNMLGFSRDDPEVLARGAKYLRKTLKGKR